MKKRSKKLKFQLSLPWGEGQQNNVIIQGSNACVDIKDENWLVTRICLDEDYCKTNSCITLCDQKENFNVSVEWTPVEIEKEKLEFQKIFNDVLDNETLKSEQFDRRSEYILDFE